MDRSNLKQNVEVPYENLEPGTLRNFIEEYIERDGTYYGVNKEISMDDKVDLVIEQLRVKEAVITWNTNLETGTIELTRGLK
jgi:uncharacterized protein YheU (UPF0270 family)